MAANIIVEHRLIADPTVVQLLQDIRSTVMATAAELTTRLNDLNTKIDTIGAQIDKAKGEITAATADAAAQIAALQQQLANAGDIPPEVIGAADQLANAIATIGAKTQALDDLNPDA